MLASHRLAGNALWNLVGQGAPLISAVVFVPILVRGLGTERFGVLSLAWVVVGYFSLFDIGIGRALTKLVAERLGTHDKSSIPILAWNALVLIGALGTVGGAVLALISPWLTGVLRVPDELRLEVLCAFRLLGVSIPVVVLSASLRGLLEAYQRFSLVVLVRLPLGVVTFAGPAAVLPFSRSVVAGVSVLVVARIASALVYLHFCSRVHPGVWRWRKADRQVVRTLLTFGGWMTVSNIVSPIMTYMDRFVIGAWLSLSWVTFYAPPYELVARLSVIPDSLMGVMFPAFATVLGVDPPRASRLFRYSVLALAGVMLPITLVIATMAPEGLRMWLGEDFAAKSTTVLRLFAGGALVSSLAQVPFAMIQSSGRADITAKLHLIELPLYLGVFTLLVTRFGIAGAASAWLIRVGLDAVALFVVVGRLLPAARFAMVSAGWGVGVVAVLFGVGVVVQGVIAKASFLGAFFVGYGLILGRARLGRGGETLLRALLGMARSRPSRVVDGGGQDGDGP